jgi:hypothetical protein
LTTLGKITKAFLVILLAATISSSFSSGVLKSAHAQSEPIAYSLFTNKGSYVLGEVVHAVLTATNQGTEPVTFFFSDSCVQLSSRRDRDG